MLDQCSPILYEDFDYGFVIIGLHLFYDKIKKRSVGLKLSNFSFN